MRKIFFIPISLTALLFGMLWPTTLPAAAESHFRSDFASGWKGWRGWSATSPVKLDTVHDRELDEKVLILTLANPRAGAWNVPVADIKPITVSSRTMIRFKVRSELNSDSELTFFDETEGAEYSIFFPTKKGEWITIQKYLFKADHKRNGKPGMPNDGLLGDVINGFRLATRGPEIRVADVEIFEADDEEEIPFDESKAALNIHLADYQVPDYPILRRNGVFPYGAVTRIDGNVISAKLFDRPIEESLRDDLTDMRRHYLNTYLNFCERSPLPLRLKLAEELGIRLIETMFCGTNFAALPSDAPQWNDFNMAKNSPALLAWYGKDEPLPSDYPSYLANKKKIMKVDAEHPLTSALHMQPVRKALGPLLEVMVPDIYPLYPNVPEDGAAILQSTGTLLACRELTAGKRIWFMTQTFSNRHPREGRFEYSARYPTPEEIRLMLYTGIASGASGILFFIYNDIPTFLDGKLRGEEFDRTLVDPWGNGNPVYDQIAEFGKRIVPIMPSFLDATPGEYIRIKPERQLLIRQLKNEFGVLAIPVNTSVKENWSGKLSVVLPAGNNLYNLETLKPATIPLQLRPGEGAVLLIATPEHSQTISAEIASRRDKVEAELSEIRRKELVAAGFSDGKASSEWLAAEKQLLEIRQIFGKIHVGLTAPSQIWKVENGAEFKPLHDELKSLSQRFFLLFRELRVGRIPPNSELRKLKLELETLAARYQKL